MKVLLIDLSPFTEAVTPVSLGYIGAALAGSGHQVEVISIGQSSAVSLSRLEGFLGEFEPALVGFTTYQRNLPHIIALARLIKEKLPRASIVLGGPQASLMPDQGLAALSDIDFLCRSEGEAAIEAIAEAVLSGDGAQAVPGATRRTADGGILTGPSIESAGDLDAYPSPWLSGMLDPAATSESIMLASRGCPHNCEFCSVRAFYGSIVRYRRMDDVLADIEACGRRFLFFTDDNLFADRARAKSLLQAAGHGDGFELTIHTLTNSPFPEIAQAVQANLAKGGIKANIVTLEGKTLWPKYRAREHDIILARWSPDYVDPHSNADAFAHNPDNRLEAKLTGVLAWRNAWADESSNMLAVKARNELDIDKRKQQYLDLQAMLQKKGPFVIMFQQNEQVARRTNLQGFVSGSNFDLVFYRNVKKQ